MATINGVEVIGDKTAHDFDLLDKNDGINLANGVERNREATEDNHQDIVLHRTDRDVHVTPEWKNSLVTKEILGLYWTAAQTADIINEISIAGGAKLVKVDELPETGKEQTIYLVPKADPQQGDIFDEYVWVDGKYEFIGTTKADLSGCFPITGGALTGNIIERNTDSDHLGVSGAYWGHGAYLWLSGQNSGYGGAWHLSARDTEKSCDLIGSPAGVLSWGGKLVATEDDLANYLPKAGGQMTGEITSANDKALLLCGGENSSKGPNLQLIGDAGQSDAKGSFVLLARNSEGVYSYLKGTPTGSLLWCENPINIIEEQGEGYIRYTNGIQICWGSGYTAESLRITMPKSFLHSPKYIVCISPIGTNSKMGFSYVNDTAFDVIAENTTDYTYIAIGRWK